MRVATPDLRGTGWAVASVLLAIVSVQSGAAVAKTLFPLVGPMGMTALRTSIAALLLTILWRPWRGGALSPRAWRAVMAYGLSLGFMNLLFYLALRRLPLGIAVSIEFVGPFTLALATSRRVSDLCWLVLAIAGLVGLLPMGRISGDLDPVGIAYALGAGACWALYIVFGHRVGALLAGGRAAALGMVMAALASLPFGLATAGPASFSAHLLGLGLLVALLSSAIPYPLEMVALKRLPGRTFGILTSLDPALAALSGMALLGEHLSLLQWAAVGCVVLASLGSTLTAAGERTGSSSRRER